MIKDLIFVFVVLPLVAVHAGAPGHTNVVYEKVLINHIRVSWSHAVLGLTVFLV